VAQTWHVYGSVRAIFGGNLQEGDHVEDAGLAGRLILSWFFLRSRVGEHRLG